MQNMRKSQTTHLQHNEAETSQEAPMKIVRAVKMAIEEGDDSLWAVYCRGGCAIHLHHTQSGPDRTDPEIFGRLARKEQSTRARMTFVEREDGTLRPWLLFTLADFDRRVGPRLGPEFRKSNIERLEMPETP
jgi:hypothetical protein